MSVIVSSLTHMDKLKPSVVNVLVVAAATVAALWHVMVRGRNQSRIRAEAHGLGWLGCGHIHGVLLHAKHAEEGPQPMGRACCGSAVRR